jgi:glycosyltransferase involved in cell wall biosynthesis
MFLLTSRYEAGWPYVIIEAMSCGLPIVTSVCYGMSDVAEAKLSHCWTFPVGSVDGCEEALKSAARAGNFEGINHRVIAQKRFSVQACFGALLDLYRLPGYGTLKSEKLTQRREALV